MMASRSWLGRLSFLLFLFVLLGAVLSARVIVEGEAELSASNAAFDRGDLSLALDHARRSATLYAPGAPHVGRAYERLHALALGAESAGQPQLAFAAWQAVRSAALESRHVLIPRENELARANENLARLEALLRATDEATRAGNQSRALAVLAADDAPRPAWIALLGCGFLAALCGLLLFSFRGFSPTGRVSLGRARVGLVLFAIGAVCWTLAAYKA